MGGGVERADRGTTLSPVLEVVDFASSVVRRICVRGTPLACAADNPLVAAMGNGAGKMIFVFRSGEIEIWELSVASLESSLHSYLLRRGLRLPRGMDLASMVEVWDRHPVSLDGDIQVRVLDVSPPLAQDDAYRALAEKQGLLKWVLKLEPRGTEGSTRSISWTVRVNRSSDMDITPIPE